MYCDNQIKHTNSNLVMNQHLLVIFVYVHQRYNTYWYVETDFYVYHRPRKEFVYFFQTIFLPFLIVYFPYVDSLPLHQDYDSFTKREGLEK